MAPVDTQALQRFRGMFGQATGGQTPYPYQERLATADVFPELLDAPTGLGKTAAAELGWVFRRRFHPKEKIRRETPRRLVYCLPMRVLVEQIFGETVRWLDRLGRLKFATTWREVAAHG